MKVHILCTVRKPELLPAALLVFKTLRVGFPTAEINIWWNGEGEGEFSDEFKERKVVFSAAPKVNGFADFKWFDFKTVHHEWILKLFAQETEPFWIVDTDLCFWDSMEQFDFSGWALAGRYTPQFKCSFANAITRPRLHTCLLYIDPARVKEAVQKYGEQFPDVYCTPRPTLQDLVYPRYIPHRFGVTTKSYFYDSMALLFQAIGGQYFTEEQNLAFDHVGSGSLVDLVAPNYPRGNITEFQAAVMDQPHLLKGQWKRDLEHYKSQHAE